MDVNQKIICFQCDAELQYKKGLQAYEMGDFEQAKIYLHNACLRDRNHLEYQLIYARVLTDSRDWKQAVAVLNNLKVMGWNDDECDLLLTICYMNLGEIEQAEICADQYVELIYTQQTNVVCDCESDQKRKIHILLHLALNYIELETYDDLLRAIFFLKQVVKLDQGRHAVYDYLARAFLGIKEYANAKECLDYVLEQNPHDIVALCSYIQLCHETGEKQELAKLLIQMENLIPIREIERLRLGYIFAKLGKYKEALSLLNCITRPDLRSGRNFSYWVSECRYHLGHSQVPETYRNRLKGPFVQ